MAGIPGINKGRPRVPGSGRAPGTPNKNTREIREWIMANANPVEFFASVMHGHFPNPSYTEINGKKVEELPTRDQRITAASELIKKVVPNAEKAIDEKGEATEQIKFVFGWADED